jgi:hypothetical protein
MYMLTLFLWQYGAKLLNDCANGIFEYVKSLVEAGANMEVMDNV